MLLSVVNCKLVYRCLCKVICIDLVFHITYNLQFKVLKVFIFNFILFTKNHQSIHQYNFRSIYN